MQTNTLPEIDDSDLKAARQFLTSLRDEERRERSSRIPLDTTAGVTLRNGITRARHRLRAPSEV
ncbi:MAG: hypothetical protein P4L84_28005 [Isosphaeraceae bacterium]|nr:hypothetical protein [Isosphaeraceae bacterium]